MTGPITGRGYLFYCGSPIEMLQCLPSSVALTVTSLPYWEGGPVPFRRHGGSMEGDTYRAFMYRTWRVFSEVFRVTRSGGFCCVSVGAVIDGWECRPTHMHLTKCLLDIGWDLHMDIVWTGRLRPSGRQRHALDHPKIATEHVMVFSKPGDGIIPRYGIVKNTETNLWETPAGLDASSDLRPFPMDVAERLVLLYSNKDDVVLDPFLGGGQAAVAAVKNGRRCVAYDDSMRRLADTARRIVLMRDVVSSIRNVALESASLCRTISGNKP